MAGIKHISASSITLFQDCERKWFYSYILGQRGETTPAMLRGSKIHKHLENYLEQGTQPPSTEPEGIIAATGLQHLPKPSEHNRVEVSLDELPLAEPLEVPFKGFIDLLDTAEDGTPVILDHKTTAGAKYMKTEAELRENTQLIIYAKHVLDNMPEAQEIDLCHVYYTTRKPYKSEKRVVRVTRQHVEAEFDKIKLVVEKMIKASMATKDLTVQNRNFCKAYNRTCDHYDECFYTITRRETRPMSAKQKAALAYLRGETPEQAPTLSDVKTAETREKWAAAVGSASETHSTDSSTHLYVGVTVHAASVDMGLLSDALAPMVERVCKKHGTQSIYTIKYKQGWDDLAELIEQEGLPAGEFYVNPASEYWTRLCEVLMSKATKLYMQG